MLHLKAFTREHGSIADMPRNNPCNVPIPCLARSPAYGNFDHARREALKRAVFPLRGPWAIFQRNWTAHSVSNCMIYPLRPRTTLEDAWGMLNGTSCYIATNTLAAASALCSSAVSAFSSDCVPLPPSLAACRRLSDCLSVSVCLPVWLGPSN